MFWHFCFIFLFKKVFLNSCSKEEDEVMLYSCVSVCPSVCLSPSISSIFFLYAFKEKYETCWIVSNCQTTDQVDTFVACSLHIFQKIILYIPFFLQCLGSLSRSMCTKKRQVYFVLLRLGSLSGFGCSTVWVDSGYKGCIKW